MQHSTTITPKPATATSLAGWTVTCTCGLTFGTTVTPQVEASRHLDWHARSGR